MFLNRIRAVGIILLLSVAGQTLAGQYDDTTFNAGLEISVVNKPSYTSGGTSTLNFFKSSTSNGKLALQKSEPGITAFLGMRFTENWGAQAGFSFIQKVYAQVQNGQTAANKINNIFIDLLAFINVAKNVDMMGLFGYGMLRSSPSVSNTFIYNQGSLSKRKLGIRLGGGAQYNFSGNWSSRALLYYQKGNPVFLKSMISFSLGLLYTFA